MTQPQALAQGNALDGESLYKQIKAKEDVEQRAEAERKDQIAKFKAALPELLAELSSGAAVDWRVLGEPKVQFDRATQSVKMGYKVQFQLSEDWIARFTQLLASCSVKGTKDKFSVFVGGVNHYGVPSSMDKKADIAPEVRAILLQELNGLGLTFTLLSSNDELIATETFTNKPGSSIRHWGGITTDYESLDYQKAAQEFMQTATRVKPSIGSIQQVEDVFSKWFAQFMKIGDSELFTFPTNVVVDTRGDFPLPSALKYAESDVSSLFIRKTPMVTERQLELPLEKIRSISKLAITFQKPEAPKP